MWLMLTNRFTGISIQCRTTHSNAVMGYVIPSLSGLKRQAISDQVREGILHEPISLDHFRKAILEAL